MNILFATVENITLFNINGSWKIEKFLGTWADSGVWESPAEEGDTGMVEELLRLLGNTWGEWKEPVAMDLFHLPQILSPVWLVGIVQTHKK